jgi:hypothetical protein
VSRFIKARKRNATISNGLWRALPWLLAGSVFLGGCHGGGSLSGAVKEPPYIPAPPAASQAEAGPPSIASGTAAGEYADLLNPDDPAHLHPRLKEAVAQAIQWGVLHPTGYEERFEPQNPITYSELRDWIIRYQKALVEAQAPLPADTTVTKSGEPRELSELTKRPDSLDSPMNPNKLLIPPSNMSLGTHHLSDNTVLTREELCGLYAFLSHQDSKANALSTDDIETAAPSSTEATENATLSDFKDWSNISDWAQKYVAVAYQDNLLKRLFLLTPNHLTVEEGFLPQKVATRGDAIILLNIVYGRQPGKEKLSGKPSTSKPPSKQNPPVEMPHPLKTLQSLQESGPNGTRNALRVSSPE